MDKIVKIILIILTFCILTGVCFINKENFAKNKILKKKCKNLGRKFKNGKCTKKCLNKKFKYDKSERKCINPISIKCKKLGRKFWKGQCTTKCLNKKFKFNRWKKNCIRRKKTKKSKGKQSKKDNLIIASLLPLSGDLADLGPGIALGASLAVKQVNAAGGVNGQPVQLIESDSSCPGEMASQSFNDIIAQGAQGVIGPVCTGTAFDILDTAIKNKIVMVSPASTSPQFTKIDKKGFFARTIPSDTLIGDALASLLVEDGIKTISIITRSDTYGRNIAKSITTVFEAAGRTVMKTVYYDSDESDFTGDVTNLVKNGIPDAFVGILIKNACNILESALKQNLLDIPWYFSDDVKDARFYSSCSLKNKLDGFKGVSPGSTPGKGKDAFEAAYAKVSKDGRPTFPSAPEAYDATMLIILSAIKNGVTGPEISSGLVDVSSTGGKKCTGVECIELAKKGENFEYVGASGTIKLNSKGDRTTATYDIWQIQGDENLIIKQIVVNNKK